MRRVPAGPQRVCSEHQSLELPARRKGSALATGRAASTRLRAEPFTWKSVVKLSSIMPRLLATAALFLSMSSCSENLDSSGVCKVLCPQVGGDVQNITLEGAVALDTSVLSFSG